MTAYILSDEKFSAIIDQYVQAVGDKVNADGVCALFEYNDSMKEKIHRLESNNHNELSKSVMTSVEYSNIIFGFERQLGIEMMDSPAVIALLGHDFAIQAKIEKLTRDYEHCDCLPAPRQRYNHLGNPMPEDGECNCDYCVYNDSH